MGQSLAAKKLEKLKESELSLATKVKGKKSYADSFYMYPTDSSEVRSIISQLKADSAPGLDGITNRLVRVIGDVIVEPLTHIFNMSLASGVFPEDWKVAAMIPIHKGGDKDNPSNYRPISLLGAFSKILGKTSPHAHRLHNCKYIFALYKNFIAYEISVILPCICFEIIEVL